MLFWVLAEISCWWIAVRFVLVSSLFWMNSNNFWKTFIFNQPSATGEMLPVQFTVTKWYNRQCQLHFVFLHNHPTKKGYVLRFFHFLSHFFSNIFTNSFENNMWILINLIFRGLISSTCILRALLGLNALHWMPFKNVGENSKYTCFSLAY